MVTVGNIPWHTGDDVLACHFATAGRLISCQIQRHADTLRSKGWAYVRVSCACHRRVLSYQSIADQRPPRTRALTQRTPPPHPTPQHHPVPDSGGGRQCHPHPAPHRAGRADAQRALLQAQRRQAQRRQPGSAAPLAALRRRRQRHGRAGTGPCLDAAGNAQHDAAWAGERAWSRARGHDGLRHVPPRTDAHAPGADAAAAAALPRDAELASKSRVGLGWVGQGGSASDGPGEGIIHEL